MKIIDIHTHGICGYDTRTRDESDILKMAEIHASHGVTEIIPTLYPDMIEVMRENMLAVKKAMEMQRLPSPHPSSLVGEGEGGGGRGRVSATILGVHLEGPFLNPLRCGALNAAAFIEPTEYNLGKLLEGFEDIVKIITIAPEIESATKLIRKIADMGIIASMGHSDATYLEAEAGLHAGAKGITHLFNAMRGIHHREPGIAGFGLLNDTVYAEVIADPRHLHRETLRLIFRTKNPARILLVSDSVKGTKAPFNPPISPFSKGGLRGIWGMGELGGEERGIIDPSGRLQGGSMTIAESSRRLTDIGFDEEVVKGCISKNPAKYLSL